MPTASSKKFRRSSLLTKNKKTAGPSTSTLASIVVPSSSSCSLRTLLKVSFVMVFSMSGIGLLVPMQFIWHCNGFQSYISNNCSSHDGIEVKGLSNESDNKQHIMYGHIHIGKTGGTSLNGILANKFTRVCGNKGYSYSAFQANEKAKAQASRLNVTSIQLKWREDRINDDRILEIGFEDCDYLSHEIDFSFFINTFGNNRFHGVPMELHVPCRDPVDHILSKCNMDNNYLNCTSDEEGFYKSIEICVPKMGRFSHRLKQHFPNRIKCYDFRKQFTSYIDYMSKRLQPRKIVSKPYIQRDTNKPRNKTNECIWDRPDLQEKARKYLISKYDYYDFCSSCMGSEDEITRDI